MVVIILRWNPYRFKTAFSDWITAHNGITRDGVHFSYFESSPTLLKMLGNLILSISKSP